MKKAQRIIRYILTLGLLVEVWLNAHWSVSLLLTLGVIQSELLGEILKKIKLHS
jgi:hypothetical protein